MGGGAMGAGTCGRFLPLTLALLAASLPLPDASPGLRARVGLPALRCGRPRHLLGLRLAGGFNPAGAEEGDTMKWYHSASEPPSPGSSAEWDEISFPPDHEAAAREDCEILTDVKDPFDEEYDSWDKGTVTKLPDERLPMANWSADFDARHPPAPKVRSDRKRARTEEPEDPEERVGEEESISDSWTSDDDPEAQLGEDLREAAFRADEAAALPLVCTVADVDISSATNMTALHAACVGGSLRIVNALLERGALVNARDNLNHSALHLAAGGGFVDIVAALVKRGVDLHAQTLLGDTARDHANRTAKLCSNASGFLSYNYGYNLTKVAECLKVDRLLEGLGVRARNNSEEPIERIKRMVSQWDPKEMGYWSYGKNTSDAASDETSDPPVMEERDLAHRIDLYSNYSMGELLRVEAEGKDDTWDTSGQTLKTPVEGPEGNAWRDPWGHDMHWWIRRQRAVEKKEAEEVHWEDDVEDGQEESLDEAEKQMLDRDEEGPWWDETNAEHEDRLRWMKALEETAELETRLRNGETTEDIALEAIAKGPPPPEPPTLQDKMEHWIEKKYWNKEWETTIPKMMETVLKEEETPCLGGLSVLPEGW